MKQYLVAFVAILMSGAVAASDLPAVAGQKGSVRANLTLLGDVLTSDIRFENQEDPQQYGSSEHAVLKRVRGK